MTATPFGGPLVPAPWLVAHLDEVRVVDTRWYLDGRSGLEAYRGGHLPGAVWLDIDRDLSAPATPHDGRHPLPSPDVFAEALGRVGIAAGTPVVVYDDAGGSIAARLWWMLHVLGEPVAVLDGGLSAWPGALATDEPHVTRVRRTPQPWPTERFLTADQIAGTDAVVLDARTRVRYADGDPAIDPRPGHIPGAYTAPWADNLDPETGRFLPAAALRHRYRLDAGQPPPNYVAYCGSGVTACHDLLALTAAGHTDTALYAGSWSQWGADVDRPAEREIRELTDP